MKTIDKKAEANLIKIFKKPKLIKLSLPILYLVVILFFTTAISKGVCSGECGNQHLRPLCWVYNWNDNISPYYFLSIVLISRAKIKKVVSSGAGRCRDSLI